MDTSADAIETLREIGGTRRDRLTTLVASTPAAASSAVSSPRHFHLFLAGTAIIIPTLLLLDTRGLVPQLALGLTTAAFLWLFASRAPANVKQTICAILVASTGEVILSLGWGLYTYRNALIPLYVPFGHGIFYALAAESARQEALQRIAPAITRAVLIAGSAIAAVSLLFFHDEWGLLWWIAAAALILRSRNQLLLCACFTYTLLLEWVGTAIGNWHWAAEVPFVGLRSANPPSGVGILYILLDLIVVTICASVVRTSSRTTDAHNST
jgi:hypothetical protein